MIKCLTLGSVRKFVCLIAFSLVVCIDFNVGDIHKDQHTSGLQTKDVIFIVLSQVNEFHVRLATEFKTHFENQLSSLDKNSWPKLLFTHKDFVDIRGAWTVFPLIEHIVKEHAHNNTCWVLICEESTRVNISLLISELQQYDATENLFLGRELRDQETTIIHHFAFADNPSQFAYPDFRAAFVMSIALIKHLHRRLQTGRIRKDFSIDPKHEFALFVWDEGNGTRLTHIKLFCSADTSSDPTCITSQPMRFPDCGNPVEKSDLFVAVKTCQKFHDSRIPFVKATWGKEAEMIEYFSEVADHRIPTTDLGVPNTERGHCGKTLAIIQRIVHTPKLSALKWVLIADDDTIINLDRLRALLACYNPQQPVVLGERYGYGVVDGGGYDYITGGGGMVFSLPALRLLVGKCRCYADDAPDDMTLGMCFKSLGVPLTHSHYFHQARPDDYSQELLANQLVVSFHKHWNNDPYKVYAYLTTSVQDKTKTRKENHSVPSENKLKEEL